MEHIPMLNNNDQRKMFIQGSQLTKRITTSDLKPLITRKTTTYGVGNSGTVIEQAEKM